MMSTRLGDEFEAFFSHVRTIYGHTKPQVVSAVRAVMREEGGAAPFLKNAFLPLANAYAAVRLNGAGGDDALTERMRWHITYLNRLADGDWAPAAMLALKNRRENAREREVTARRDRPRRASVAAVVSRYRKAEAPVRRDRCWR